MLHHGDIAELKRIKAYAPPKSDHAAVQRKFFHEEEAVEAPIMAPPEMKLADQAAAPPVDPPAAPNAPNAPTPPPENPTDAPSGEDNSPKRLFARASFDFFTPPQHESNTAEQTSTEAGKMRSLMPPPTTLVSTKSSVGALFSSTTARLSRPDTTDANLPPWARSAAHENFIRDAIIHAVQDEHDSVSEPKSETERVEGKPGQLSVNPVGDQFEQEADAVAEHIVEQRTSTDGSPTQGPKMVQRQATEYTDDQHIIAPEIQAQIERLDGSGTPLTQELQAQLGGALGVDLSHVRIHTDLEANALAENLQSHAFTHGPHIVFNQGEFDPESADGLALLAHELTHVVQQGAAREVNPAQLDAEQTPFHMPGMENLPEDTIPANRIAIESTPANAETEVEGREKPAAGTFPEREDRSTHLEATRLEVAQTASEHQTRNKAAVQKNLAKRESTLSNAREIASKVDLGALSSSLSGVDHSQSNGETPVNLPALSDLSQQQVPPTAPEVQDQVRQDKETPQTVEEAAADSYEQLSSRELPKTALGQEDLLNHAGIKPLNPAGEAPQQKQQGKKEGKDKLSSHVAAYNSTSYARDAQQHNQSVQKADEAAAEVTEKQQAEVQNQPQTSVEQATHTAHLHQKVEVDTTHKTEVQRHALGGSFTFNPVHAGQNWDHGQAGMVSTDLGTLKADAGLTHPGGHPQMKETLLYRTTEISQQRLAGEHMLNETMGTAEHIIQEDHGQYAMYPTAEPETMDPESLGGIVVDESVAAVAEYAGEVAQETASSRDAHDAVSRHLIGDQPRGDVVADMAPDGVFIRRCDVPTIHLVQLGK
ncbi:MAG: DUF4157 domain-containing protein, partial [Bacteroidota bacterium]